MQNKLSKNYAEVNKNIAAISNSDFDENSIEENFIGEFKLICEYCNAKHFPFELTTDKKFKNCCHKGTVKLPSDADYPKEIKEMKILKS